MSTEQPLRASCVQPDIQLPYSLPTLKCDGDATFRSRTARDVACLIDLDTNVVSWRTRTVRLESGGQLHVVDFELLHEDGTTRLLDAPDRAFKIPVQELQTRALSLGYEYEVIDRGDIYSGCRLQNARDLLRYARFLPMLADRIRLLATLDEHGSLPVSDCLQVITSRDPVAVLASLILAGLLEVELDMELIGPETVVRRIRR